MKMKMPYKLEIIPNTEEEGYVASYPEFPNCIYKANTTITNFYRLPLYKSMRLEQEFTTK